MPNPLVKRLAFWKDIFYGKVRVAVAFLITLATIGMVVRDLFVDPRHREFALLKYAPEWPWQAWVLIGVSALLVLTLEGSYSKFQRDQIKFRNAYRGKVKEAKLLHKAELLAASVQGLGTEGSRIGNSLPAAAIPQAESEPEPEPNLACKRIRKLPSHWMYGILTEGHASRLEDSYAYVAEITNDFRSPRAGRAKNLSARMFYTPSGGPTTQVNRGAWLSKGNRVDLWVNDTENLIICFAPVSDPFAVVFQRDYFDGAELSDLGIALGEGNYSVEVHLISEAKGLLYKTLFFDLTVKDKPEFSVQLLEVDRGSTNSA